MTKRRWLVHYVDAYNNEYNVTVEADACIIAGCGALAFSNAADGWRGGEIVVDGFQHGTWKRFHQLPEETMAENGT